MGLEIGSLCGSIGPCVFVSTGRHCLYFHINVLYMSYTHAFFVLLSSFAFLMLTQHEEA